MATNLDPKTLHDFIVGDFTDAWNALAGVPGAGIHRGNFMFGRQAMTLLEWAARLCKSDGSGAALTAFSTAVEKIDSRYFTPLPDVCMNAGAEFELPASPTRGPGERQLLWAMLDLIRNGQAHQYQQINVTLKDGTEFAISLSGAREGLFLDTSMTGGRPAQHLAFALGAAGEVILYVRTDVLFLDIRQAVADANLLARGLTFKYLERPDPRRGAGNYNFDSASLERALGAGGHPRDR